MVKVEVAVWHPVMSAADIEDLIGLPARISWTVGEKRRSDGGAYPETYCRFSVGIIAKANSLDDLSKALERFRELSTASKIKNDRSLCLVYFSGADSNSEFYLGAEVVNYLCSLNVGVVYRNAS